MRGIRENFEPGVAREGEAPWVRDADAELVERLRKDVQRWSRWRWVFVIVFSLLTGAVAWAWFQVIEMVQGIQELAGKDARGAEIVVLIGAGLGFKLGLLLHAGIMGLITGLSDDFRMARLLVKYHDRIRELEGRGVGGESRVGA